MGIFGGRVDVLFFDVTTLSFASDSEDELRKKGYNKDGKPQGALIQKRQGLDELFACNSTDVKTLDPAIAARQQRFALGKIAFVTDAGMMSQENLTLLLSKGYDFVVAARLRPRGKKATRDITTAQEWQPMGEGRMVAERRLGGGGRAALGPADLSEESGQGSARQGEGHKEGQAQSGAGRHLGGGVGSWTRER